MKAKELSAKCFLARLRRHPMPEILDDECLAAPASVEAQYGDAITHGAGPEVRLGEEARYADYIMNIDEANIPGVYSLWHEIDYAEFRKGTAKKFRRAFSRIPISVGTTGRRGMLSCRRFSGRSGRKTCAPPLTACRNVCLGAPA